MPSLFLKLFQQRKRLNFTCERKEATPSYFLPSPMRGQPSAGRGPHGVLRPLWVLLGASLIHRRFCIVLQIPGNSNRR